MAPHSRSALFSAPLLAIAMLALGGSLAGCQEKEPSKEATPSATLTPPVASSAVPQEDELLKREWARILAEPGLDAAPGFTRRRAELVARAKSEPIVMTRTPQAGPFSSTGMRSAHRLLSRTAYPWKVLRQMQTRFKRRPHLLRQLVLREGYLYSEDPNFAFNLVSLLRPHQLFKDKEIWVHRGSHLMHARRSKTGRYTFTDGPLEGQKVRLLHLDRMGTGSPPAPLHRDVRSLRYRLFFDRLESVHMTDKRMLVLLHYGSHKVKAILESDGASLKLQGMIQDRPERGEIEREMTLARRRLQTAAALQTAMRAQVDERLPFDEPKTEIGQEDGKLRRLWRYAYRTGRKSFKFNEDTYYVFDRAGRARPPQVCVDFLVDTLERASGSWWLPRQAGQRGRTEGKLSFREFGIDRMRQSRGFITLAKEHPDWFDVLYFPERTRIELGYKRRFFRWLTARTNDFQVGDVVVIRGLTPWDEENEHTHTFFVYETDPVTGVPIAIAGNAGPANLWSWETEARRTPHRTLRYRLRPKLEWLESVLLLPDAAALMPPALEAAAR